MMMMMKSSSFSFLLLEFCKFIKHYNCTLRQVQTNTISLKYPSQVHCMNSDFHVKIP